METRDENGLWLKGVSGNPNGRPKSPWMPYGVRLSMWLEKPATEIKALIGDTDKLESLSCIDVACVKHVTKMMFGKEALKALELALDRIEGKAVQTMKIGGDGGDAIKIADATKSVFGMLDDLADRKQSGGTEADCMAETGEAGTDNAER